MSLIYSSKILFKEEIDSSKFLNREIYIIGDKEIRTIKHTCVAWQVETMWHCLRSGLEIDKIFFYFYIIYPTQEDVENSFSNVLGELEVEYILEEIETTPFSYKTYRVEVDKKILTNPLYVRYFLMFIRRDLYRTHHTYTVKKDIKTGGISWRLELEPHEVYHADSLPLLEDFVDVKFKKRNDL